MLFLPLQFLNIELASEHLDMLRGVDADVDLSSSLVNLGDGDDDVVVDDDALHGTASEQ